MNTKKSKLSRSLWLLAAAPVLAYVPVGTAQENEAAEDGEKAWDQIVVTATRREEFAQDTPLSLTVLPETELEKRGAEEFLDFARQIPGLNVNETNRGAVDIGIRGIRTLTAGVGGATVGYYLDEISVSTPNGTPLVATFDLNRVEVLRGPQGTLFGEGSLGGTIRFISNKPDSSAFSGRLKARYANIEQGGAEKSVAGVINVPIVSDSLALRVSGQVQRNGGFIDNVAPGFEERDINDHRINSVRAVLGWTPTDRLTITPSVTYQDGKFRGSAGETLVPDPLTPGAFVPIGELQRFEPGLTDERNQNEFVQPSLVVDYAFDGVQFTSASNYYDSELTGVGGILGRTNEIFTQEVRAVSTGDGPFQWVLGGFFKDQEAVTTINFVTPGFSLFIGNTTNLKQLAGFGTLSYTFFERLTLDVGGRLFWEDVDETAVQDTVIPLPPPLPPFEINSLAVGGGENTHFNPRVNLSYDVTDDVMVYFSAAKGFRRGQVNPIDSSLPFVPEGVPQFTSPDTIWSYEGGLKSVFWGGDARFNVAVFYLDWNNIQIADAIVLPGPTVIEFIRNAGAARSYGVEFDFAWQATEALYVALNGQVSRAELAEDLPNGLGADGDELPTSPSYQLNGTIEYSRPVANGLEGFLRADFNAVDGQLSAIGAPDALARSDSYVLVDLRAGVEWDQFQLHLFAQNVFDERAQFSFDAVNDFEIIRNQPRTYGVELLASF